MFSSRCIYIIVFLSLTACGGGDSTSSATPNNTAPITVPPVTSPSEPTMDLSGQTGNQLLVAKKVNGIETNSLANINSSFSNAVGALRHVNTSTNIEGNLTLGVVASDIDVMKQVSLYLPNVERNFILCLNNCRPDFQSTITGFNPQLAGELAGPLRIELVVEDNLGNSAVVDALNVNWQPIQISAINASRENGIVSVSWSGNDKVERYNLYAATELGLTTLNALQLDNGVQRLAIKGTSAQFTDAELNKDYSLLVTGIDNGGESGASVPHILPRVGGIPNLPPIANNDNYQLNEDEALTVNVLDNDQDPEGQLIVLDSILLQPVNGNLIVNGNLLTYTPHGNFYGSDSVSYRVVDAEGGNASATVVFDVLPINDPPIAIDDSYRVDTTGFIDFDITNLLSNDYDVDDAVLSVSTTPAEAPKNGTLILRNDGTFSYQSLTPLLENDEFIYQILDSQGASAFAKVKILANGDILPPIAQNDDYTIDEDTTLVIDTVNLGILANDSDPNGLTFELVANLLSQPQHGQLNLALDGTFTYIPNSNFFGVDQFQYQIKNSAELYSQASVTITVQSTADIPIALDDNYQVEEDSNLQVDEEAGLLLNDMDFDSSILKVNTTPVTSPQKGTLVLEENGSFNYTPNANFSGIDSFTYEIINGNQLTDTANVNITVMPLNDAPTVNNESVTINEDTTAVVDVLANDSDIDGDQLSLISVDVDSGNAVIVNNAVHITPNIDFFGQITASYTVSDSFNATNTGTLTVMVLPVNDNPIAINNSYSSPEDVNVIVSINSPNHLLANDSDVDGDTLTVNTTPLTNVSHGSLALNSDGSFSYTPNSNFNGVDSFTYQVSDGNGATAQASVSLTINAVNDAPTLNADSFSLDEDLSLTKLVTDSDQLLANDSDVDGDTLTVNTTPLTNVSHGSLALNSDGSFSYTPNSNFNGVDSFTYQVSDGNGATAQASVSLTINAVNDAPTLNADSFSLDEDLSLTKLVTDSDQLLANDSDVDGDTLTVNTTPLTNVSHGSLALNSDGSFSYTPNSNFNGVDSFTYQVSDGNGATAQASVALTINAVNDAPTLNADSFSLDEDLSLTKLVTDSDQLLANDSDVDGDTLTVNTTPLTNVSHGSLALNSDGSFSYTPNSNFNGVDSFTYQVSDGNGATAQASVSLTINAVNDAPTLNADSFSLDEDLSLTKLVTDSDQLLANDSDVDGDTLTVNTTPLTNVSHGSLALNSDGSFSYTPNSNFNGVDSFTYQVSDGNGATAQASVSLTINAVNDAPTLNADSFSLDEDLSLTKLVTDSDQLLANDSDVDGDTLTVNTTPLTNVSHGSLALNSDGSFSYTPNSNFNGVDSFTYQVSDGNGATAQANVALTINATNDAPIAAPDSYSIMGNLMFSKMITDNDHLLSNDSDLDGDTLTVNTTPLTNVSHGSLVLNSDGSFSYTPNNNFNGVDSFTYQVSDGNGATAQAVVTLTINSTNNAPVAVNDSYSFAEDFTWIRRVTDGDQLLSNDSDADGDTLTVNTTPISNVSNGSLTLNSDGSFTYIPNSNYFGNDSFTYQISDGNGGTAQATVTLIVHAMNDLPVAIADSYTFDEDITLTKLLSDGDSLLSNDNDVDGDTLTVNTSPIAGVSNGNLTLNADGSFTYIPSSDFNGTDNFSYQVSDGQGGSAQATVSLTIQAVNDAPVASDQIFSVDENKTHGDVIGTIVASDKEANALQYSLTSGDTGLFDINLATGVLTIRGNNPLDYETDTQHIVTVTITDDGAPNTASTDINVTININDISESGTVNELASFGRPVIGSLELTGIKTQAQLTDSVTHGSKVYFIGSVDNIDKDVYMVAYNRDGTLDTTFGNGGSKSYDFGDNEYGKAIINNAGNYYLAFTRDDGTNTEICFIKVDSDADLVSSFGRDGLTCTTEKSHLSVNAMVNNGNDIVAVGKAHGTDDDLLVLQIDSNGVFVDHTPGDVTDSPHLIHDISGLGLDDEGTALYKSNNDDFLIAGNVVTVNGDKDIFAWLIDENGAGVVTFNTGNAQFYDVNGTDDLISAVAGKEDGGFTVHLAGSTVLASGAKEALIIAIDDTGVLANHFGVNGIATYDVDGDSGGGDGFAEFSSIALAGAELYLSGTVYEGESKPFTTRVIAADGTVDSSSYGDINGYQKINYAGDNAFAGSMTLDDDNVIWLPGYVESGSDSKMMINAVDAVGRLCNLGCINDFSNSKVVLTHSSVASDDTVAEVIKIQQGLQKDKFLVVSTADNGSEQHIVITRLTEAGLLDSSFDSDGHKQLKIGTSAEVKGIFELLDGKFIVYGNVTESTGDNGFIARIDHNGLFDTSFASNGIYTTSAINATDIHFNQVKVDSLNRLVAVGNLENGSTNAFVVRLNSAGVLDSSFNTSTTPGYIIGANTDDYLAVLIDGSNNIYAGGNRDIGDKDMLLVKYLATGGLDLTLKGSGELTIDVNSGVDDSIEFVGFDSNNALYLVGNNLAATEKVVVVKTSTTGVLDTSFSTDGIADFFLSPLTDDSQMLSAAIDSHDNIVVAGFGEVLGTRKHMVGRIKSDGTLDNSFDNNGYFMPLTCLSASQLSTILLLNNSSYIVAGQCYINGTFGRNVDISHFQLN